MLSIVEAADHQEKVARGWERDQAFNSLSTLQEVEIMVEKCVTQA